MEEIDNLMNGFKKLVENQQKTITDSENLVNKLNKDKLKLKAQLANLMKNNESVDFTYDEWGIKRLK